MDEHDDNDSLSDKFLLLAVILMFWNLSLFESCLETDNLASSETLAHHFSSRCSNLISHIPVRSHFFGSNGLIFKNSSGPLVINSFLSWGHWSKKDFIYKIITNTDCVLETATHFPTKVSKHCWTQYPLSVKNQRPNITKYTKPDQLRAVLNCASPLQLNHYATKSKQE